MIRRLPIYIVAGCSASMAGGPIISLEQGIRTLHANLMGDPSAVESAWLSVICFGQRCEQIVPLTEVNAFPPCPLRAQPGFDSNLGDVLRLLANCVRYEVRPPSINDKGDWKPLIFLLTDSPASDEAEFRRQATEIRSQRLGNIIAVGCGDRGDAVQLRLLTDTVLVMNDMSPDAFSQFLKWVPQSRPVEQ